MDRRKFIQLSLIASGAIGVPNTLFALNQRATNFNNRLGLTTVVFRKRFSQTAGGHLTNGLTLSDIPAYFADRFGIHHVEIWSKHFESKDEAYLKLIKKAHDKTNSRIIDIQVDSPYDLSDPDDELRSKAMEDMKEWIDTGSLLNSEFIRVSSMKQSYLHAVNSVTELNKYASAKGVKLLLENHFDLFSHTKNHIGIIQATNDDNIGLLADFSNFFQDDDQYRSLDLIAPYAKLVSAKTGNYDKECQHQSFDFTRCVRIFEDAGYNGIYSLEQWGNFSDPCNEEQITDWMIDAIKSEL